MSRGASAETLQTRVQRQPDGQEKRSASTTNSGERWEGCSTEATCPSPTYSTTLALRKRCARTLRHGTQRIPSHSVRHHGRRCSPRLNARAIWQLRPKGRASSASSGCSCDRALFSAPWAQRMRRLRAGNVAAKLLPIVAPGSRGRHPPKERGPRRASQPRSAAGQRKRPRGKTCRD